MAATGNPVIATAALGLIPVVTGIRGSIGTQLAGAGLQGEADRAGKSIGSRFSSSVMSTVKSTLKLGGIVTAAIGGFTVKGGFDRALGLEDARAKMRGLGHDTATVDQIMANSLASVEGTAYGLDSAATTAAGAVAAGIKPGEQLEQTLKTVANTAAASGSSMEEMGGIFNTVAATGTAYTGDIQMLAQRGIPIWQSLADQLGVTQDEVRKMATEGKIDFATFELAARDASGGVATAMGDTTRGSFANMVTGLKKLGADLVTGFLPLLKTTFQGIQATVAAVATKIKPFIDQFFGSFGPSAEAGISGFFDGLVSKIEAFDPTPIVNFVREVRGGIIAFGAAWKYNDGEITSSGFPGFMERAGYIARTVFDEMTGGIKAFGAAWEYNDGEVTSSGFPGFMERVGYAARQLWDALKGADYSSFSAFLSSLGDGNLGPAVSSVGDGFKLLSDNAPDLLGDTLTIIGTAVGVVADNIGLIEPLLPLIAGGFVLWAGATLAQRDAAMALQAADIATLPVQIARNATSTTAATARWAAARAEIAQASATNTTTAATTRATIAERVKTVATKIGTIASKAAAVATRLLGAALRFAMGPIGWIITGIALLVGALVWFFTQTEVGQELWAKIWGAIKAAAAAVVDWFMGTALPVLQSIWDGIAAGALWLYNNSILPAWNGIRSAISAVAGWILNTAWPAIKTAWDAISNAALWLWNNVIQPVWTGIRIAIALAVAVIMTIIDGLVALWNNVLAPAAMWLYNSVIVPVWNGIKTAISVVVAAVMTYVNVWVGFFKNVVAPLFTWLWTNVITPVWNGIRVAISAVVTWFQGTAWPIIQRVIGYVRTGFDLMKLGLQVIWAFIRDRIIAPVVSWLLGTAWPTIQRVIGYIRTGFELFKLGLQVIWTFIKDRIINPVVSWFEGTVAPLFSAIVTRIKGYFTLFQIGLRVIWRDIQTKIVQPVLSWFQNTLQPKIKTVTDAIKNAFTTMKDGIKTAWDAIKSTAMSPIRFVINTVVNDGIIKNFNKVAGTFGLKTINEVSAGFKDGGVLPGYTPGRDVHSFYSPSLGRLDLSGGEAIMRPEWTRAVGGQAAVDEMNRRARMGLAFKDGGVFGAFKGGGIIPDWMKNTAGDAIDWVKEKADFAADVLADPKGALKKLVDNLLAGIPGGGTIKELAKAVPQKLAKDIGDKIAASFSAPASSGGGAVGPMPAGASRSLSYARRVASSFGLTMTSFRRRGARTAGSGMTSLHALGRAMDFSNSSGPTRQMMAFFNAMHPLRPTELLYSPAGGRQWRRSGRQADTSGATKRMHYNHVHVGFNKGGVFEPLKPYLYDQGGVIPPGMRFIANDTRRPEKVLPPRESDALSRLADRGEGGTTFVYQPQQLDLDSEIEHRQLREFESMVAAAKKEVRL